MPRRPSRKGPTVKWIPTNEISNIPGAHDPATYVARAYRHEQRRGKLPGWAMKSATLVQEMGVREGDWMFNPDYIRRDAMRNMTLLTSADIAREMQVSRRTAINWMDCGMLGHVVRLGRIGARRVRRTDFNAQKRALLMHLTRPDIAGARESMRGRPRPRKPDRM